MKIGSLFSGYGGLDLGVQDALGGTVAWHSDIDNGPRAILAHHWPDIPNLGDVSTVDWADVEPVDVITGGFPCQDVSHAGRRQGLIRDGEGKTRSGLWGEMLRAIVELQPQLVVIENVRGLLSAEADSDVEPCSFCMGADGAPPMRALGAVLADLADAGFDAAWHGLRASDVGAAHNRFRVFILAWPTPPHAGSERLRQHPRRASKEEAGPHGGHVVAGAGGWGPVERMSLLPTPVADNSRGLPSTGTDYASLANTVVSLLPTPAVNDMGAGKTVEAWDAWTDRMKAEHANGNGHGASLSIEALRMLPTPRAGDGEKGGPNQRGSSGDLMLPSAVHQAFGDYQPAVDRWATTIDRPAPAPTEPTGRDGAARLSAHFVEWLMGLPAGHITDTPGISRNAQLKALGNGVVPQQAAAAVTHLLTVATRDAVAA